MLEAGVGLGHVPELEDTQQLGRRTLRLVNEYCLGVGARNLALLPEATGGISRVPGLHRHW